MIRLVRIDIPDNSLTLQRTVDGIMVVEPLVHGTVRMATNHILVYRVEHVLEIAHREIGRCCGNWPIGKADVDASSRVEEAFFVHAIFLSIMRLLSAHARGIEILNLCHGIGRDGTVQSQRHDEGIEGCVFLT